MSPQLTADRPADLQSCIGRVDFPHKPLDNPERSKPGYSSDGECAALLQEVLRGVPETLGDDTTSRFPLLDALKALDLANGRTVARELLLIAAVNHRAADERRTAEYLLRNRYAVVAGTRSATSLLFAARYAAEMDVQRVQRAELVAARALAVQASDSQPASGNAVPAGDLVVATLRAFVPPALITPLVERALRIGVTVALELAERYLHNGGRGSAVVAMRSNARPGARLAAALRNEIASNDVASNLARLLVGPDGTSLDTGLLRWSVHSDVRSWAIPESIRSRWLRCLRAIRSALDGEPVVHNLSEALLTAPVLISINPAYRTKGDVPCGSSLLVCASAGLHASGAVKSLAVGVGILSLSLVAITTAIDGAPKASSHTPPIPGTSGGLRAGSVPKRYRAFVLDAGSICAAAPPSVIAAQIQQESGWNPNAVSPAGAEGISQFLPSTWPNWSRPGETPFQPAAAIAAQGRYDCAIARTMAQAQKQGRFSKSIDLTSLMLAGYNAGPYAALAAGGIPDNGQTPDYVRSIRTPRQTSQAPRTPSSAPVHSPRER